MCDPKLHAMDGTKTERGEPVPGVGCVSGTVACEGCVSRCTCLTRLRCCLVSTPLAAKVSGVLNVNSGALFLRGSSPEAAMLDNEPDLACLPYN